MTIEGNFEEIIRPEAIPSGPVDLVVYFGGERVVVGEAGIKADGTFTATMFGDRNDADPRITQILENVRGEFRFSLPRKTIQIVNQVPFTAGDIPFDEELNPNDGKSGT